MGRLGDIIEVGLSFLVLLPMYLVHLFSKNLAYERFEEKIHRTNNEFMKSIYAILAVGGYMALTILTYITIAYTAYFLFTFPFIETISSFFSGNNAEVIEVSRTWYSYFTVTWISLGLILFMIFMSFVTKDNSDPLGTALIVCLILFIAIVSAIVGLIRLMLA
jgi:hypothetical protein